MATICDICGEGAGLFSARIRVAGPAYAGRDGIEEELAYVDACKSCLHRVPGLRTDRSLEQIREAVVGRASSSDVYEQHSHTFADVVEHMEVGGGQLAVEPLVFMAAPAGDCAADGCVFEQWERRGSFRYRISANQCLRCGLNRREVGA